MAKDNIIVEVVVLQRIWRGKGVPVSYCCNLQWPCRCTIHMKGKQGGNRQDALSCIGYILRLELMI